MLSVKAAAARAGVCVAIVYGWVAARVLPHFRVGAVGKRGKIVIAEADLDAFLQQLRVQAAEPEPNPAPRPAKPRLKHLRVD